MWQSSFRKTSELSTGASPASIAWSSSQVKIEEKRPARYLSMKEISSAAFWSCEEEDEVDGASVALIFSFCRSWDMICVQASSASCCA